MFLHLFAVQIAFSSYSYGKNRNPLTDNQILLLTSTVADVIPEEQQSINHQAAATLNGIWHAGS